MSAPALEIECCPSCSVDGGYGAAVDGQQYRCPECRVVWSPWPGGAPVSTWIGNTLQRVKVALTSRWVRR